MKKNGLAIFFLCFFLAGCGLELDGESLLGEDFEIGKLSCDTFISGDEGELEIPPDLVPPDTSDSLIVPGNKKRVSISESALNSNALPARLDMGIRREGDVSWLAVDTEPDALWSAVTEFLGRMGFQPVESNPKHGYMVTQWRERKIPLSQQAGEAIALRTRLYVRLERDANAVTNVFFSTHSAQKMSAGWQLVPAEPDFEYSVLTRFKTYLASQREVANIRMPSLDDVKITLDIINTQGVPVLHIGQHYSKVWRRLGAALTRLGIDIRSDDRSRGLYLIGYNVSPSTEANSRSASSNYFKLHLLAQSSAMTLVTVHAAGKASRPPPYDVAYEVLKRVVTAYNSRTRLARN